MSWETDLVAFLDDLESRAAAVFDEERRLELHDRSRAEYVYVTLASRLMASVGRDVRLQVAGLGWVSGRLDRVGTGWCLCVTAQGHAWVVTTVGLGAAEGLSDRSVPEVAWSAVARLGLGSTLRPIADSGAECRIHDLEGGFVQGVLGRVGGDFVEVRPAAGRTVLVPFASIAAVGRRDETGQVASGS